MKIFNGDIVPIKSWIDDIEDDTLSQAQQLAALPFVFKHICLMPDAHSGYGMPIGGVAALKETVIPNAVGVDIGCGMSAMRTSLKDLDHARLIQILKEIRQRIPLGFSHHKHPQHWEDFHHAPKIAVVQQELDSARYQLGTLGGGNHFIELQKGSDGVVWIMVHSGSRNFGYKIAKTYNKKAQLLNQRNFPKMPQYHGEGGLAFLPSDCPEFHEYIVAMNFALCFARENRRRMIEYIKQSICEITACDFGDMLNIHHNYAAEETHFGQRVWVHRKGATSAKKDEWGIIPGSQGASSYIVKGKGNPESFCSCSHGAGRAMSRHQARKILNLRSEQEKLDQLGIVHSLRGKRDLDEAPSAYKNIDYVIQAQRDLVEPVICLRPLAGIKG